MMRAFRQACAGFVTNEGFFLAGGLAFYFVICFIPLLFLVVSITGYVLSPASVEGQIRDALASTVPVYQDEVTRTLLRMIETRKSSGLVGTGILILFSTQLFASFRIVLNRVLGVRGQPLLHGFLFDGAMVLLIGLFFVGNVGTTAVVAWVKLMAARQMEVPAHWMARMSIGLGFLFSTAMYFVIYRFFPHRSIMFRAALGGALVASGLWEVAKHFLRVYVVSFGLYDQIYGPLGVLMAFVMFVYYSAVVFVFGAEVVGALDPGG
jgi:membrane protein